MSRRGSRQINLTRMTGHDTRMAPYTRGMALRIFIQTVRVASPAFAGTGMPDTRRISMRHIADVLRLQYTGLARATGLNGELIQAPGRGTIFSRLNGADIPKAGQWGKVFTMQTSGARAVGMAYAACCRARVGWCAAVHRVHTGGGRHVADLFPGRSDL